MLTRMGRATSYDTSYSASSEVGGRVEHDPALPFLAPPRHCRPTLGRHDV